ncbi:hypothetical protein RHGRI_033431 [Rhododendron griersonianum]|uniref:Protein FAR1-RELATED SEQUENCE n=1 Tax=Rhododendron griersonianum TaxID=479676 RepID=A0AAV6HWT6_9ERIC|nr:hypothetical protein RHGRI_033431 [Rhododendron griersonianum]
MSSRFGCSSPIHDFAAAEVMDPEARCLRGEFQSRHKLDFKDDGDLLEINVVLLEINVVSGDEGKWGNDKRDANVKIHRPETRFGCLAKMKIRYCRVSQKYIVFEFGAVHTHTLCTPSKSHLFKSHRKFAPAQALEADMANDSNQDAAMAKALVAQWPETVHRLCIWHIFQNAAKQLSGVFAEFKDFAKDFSSCIYDYEEEDDFIIAWNQMLEKYGLQDNDWLRHMLCFVREIGN